MWIWLAAIPSLNALVVARVSGSVSSSSTNTSPVYFAVRAKNMLNDRSVVYRASSMLIKSKLIGMENFPFRTGCLNGTSCVRLTSSLKITDSLLSVLVHTARTIISVRENEKNE